MSLYRKSGAELSEMLRRKECSSVEICRSVLQRIELIENETNAYITVCDDILNQAEKVDKKLSAGEELHPLAGIPIGLKDNISTNGIRTTCASKMLKDYIPPYDAYVTAKLKSAGMIITGKLNMDEFAMGSSTENSFFGKTLNPHNKDFVSGGSSGGCAAAVVSGEAVMSLGSDTGGSVRQPSAFCGAVGLKPTYGSVSRYGLIAFASSLDQIGPICRDVRDTAMLYSLICGHDKMDATSAFREYTDFGSKLCCNVRGLRIGVPCEYFGGEIKDEVKESVMQAIDLLRKHGAEVKSISLPSTKYAVNAYYIISSAEASSNLARYDGVRFGYRSAEYESLSDMYTKTRSEGFGIEVKRRIMLGTFVLCSGYYDEYYQKAIDIRNVIRNEFSQCFTECDVIITPAYPSTAFRSYECKSSITKLYEKDFCTVPANLAGIPAITIPCGYSSEGLPVGMQIMGNYFYEELLFNTAYAYETLSGGLKNERI